MDNYQLLERQLAETTAENISLRVDNGAMLAEIGMLREELTTSDADRVRWQAIASTLLGRLYAISDTVSGAVRAAVKDGFEAKAPDERSEDLGKVGAEVEEVLQRAAVTTATEAPPEPQAAPAPPQAATDTIPKVDFGTGQAVVAPTMAYRR